MSQVSSRCSARRKADAYAILVPGAWIHCEVTGDLRRPRDVLVLGVSRGGFYAWLPRRLSRRSRSNEVSTAQVRALASD